MVSISESLTYSTAMHYSYTNTTKVSSRYLILLYRILSMIKVPTWNVVTRHRCLGLGTFVPALSSCGLSYTQRLYLNQIVFTIYQLIWNQTEFRLVTKQLSINYSNNNYTNSNAMMRVFWEVDNSSLSYPIEWYVISLSSSVTHAITIYSVYIRKDKSC